DTVEIEENGVNHLASLAIEFVERRKILRRVSEMEQIREVSAKEKAEGSERFYHPSAKDGSVRRFKLPCIRNQRLRRPTRRDNWAIA
ncbi:hypothetical protein ABTG43_18925, partial [Acinetobacter baumannii]